MGNATLSDYRRVVGDEPISELEHLARSLKGKRVQHVNSTRVGGGVAEILQRMVPLMQEVGLNAFWDVIEGDEAFFRVTKAFHNALQGLPQDLDEEDFEIYRATNQRNAERMALRGEFVFVHDPQPAALVELARREVQDPILVWRCHIDASAPDPRVWAFLKPYVAQYHAAVISAPAFAQTLDIPQYLVPPSIDPLSDKNRSLEPEEVRAVVERFGLDPARPIVLQVSRFDRFKDPVGVIQAYRMVRPGADCQLVLAGGTADDDPEGSLVLSEVRAAVGDDPDVHVLNLPPRSDVDINALQRAAAIVVQKSTREGFGLTVSEALWKGIPVVAGAVGGIPLQVIEGFNGYLVRSVEGAAFRIRHLLHNPEEARTMGRNGAEHVRRHFLITRHLRNYLLV